MEILATAIWHLGNHFDDNICCDLSYEQSNYLNICLCGDN